MSRQLPKARVPIITFAGSVDLHLTATTSAGLPRAPAHTDGAVVISFT